MILTRAPFGLESIENFALVLWDLISGRQDPRDPLMSGAWQVAAVPAF